jgi:hypothetical protein
MRATIEADYRTAQRAETLLETMDAQKGQVEELHESLVKHDILKGDMHTSEYVLST